MSAAHSGTAAPITSLKPTDYDEWARLFRAYIDFYAATIADDQYRKTFERLIDPSKDLYGLVLRDPDHEGKLLGIAHFYPHQTPWSEKTIMHFNGVLCIYLLPSSSCVIPRACFDRMSPFIVQCASKPCLQ